MYKLYKMNPVKLYLILSFIAYSFSAVIKNCNYNYNDETYEYTYVKPTSADDCKDRLTEKDKERQRKCCFSYYSKIKELGTCDLLSKGEYENVDKMIKIQKFQNDIAKDELTSTDDDSSDYSALLKGVDPGDYHIDCFSSLLKIGLLTFILNWF